MALTRDPVADFLLRGETYGLPGVAVSRIETHCSEIYLVGNQAYKRKRPVAFSSVDYRTLEQREAACHAELALNRRTAPELYLGNRTVRRQTNGALRLDGDGTVVDWLVAMRRFDQTDLFDRMSESGKLTAAAIRALADEIAGFHRRAETTSKFGGASGLRQAIQQNHQDLLSTTGFLDATMVGQLRDQAVAALAPIADLLDRRRDEGKVRRVHGDLRLANICLLDGRPTMFDGIEFSDALSCIDMLYDVASVLTDLHHRGAALFANILFNRYLDAVGDADNLLLLPLMLSIRATTRAYSLAGSAQRRSNLPEAATVMASAKSMFELARALLQKSPPRFVAFGGFGGSRKTSIVEQVATEMRPIPGARILRSDIVRHSVAGIPLDQRLSAHAYRPEIADRAYDALRAEAEAVLRGGHSVVIDASFFYPHHRRMFRVLAEAAGVPFVGIWLGETGEMLPTADEPVANDWPAVALDNPENAASAVRKLTGLFG
jgi:uncharacterized protein